MQSSLNIEMRYHAPMELLYSLFAIGTGASYDKMIRDFNVEPSEKLVRFITDIKNGLSRYLESELEYFYDLSGFGYIFYKTVLKNPDIAEIPEILSKFNEVPAQELVFSLVVSVCKNNMPKAGTKAYKELEQSTERMIKLVNQTKFQDSQRKERVLESLKNPEETKQRLYLLLTQFYNRFYIGIEQEVKSTIEEQKPKYQALFEKNPQKFLEQYLNLDLSKLKPSIIHLSFFKYISWHNYILVNEDVPDWFILGIYSDLLFDEDLQTEKFSNLFKALSDPNRIDILRLLSQRPWFGQELAEQLNITPATISYHMAFLQKIGAVTFSKGENRSYYVLNNSKLIKQFEDFLGMIKGN